MSKEASINGVYAETLILGKCSNPSRLIDVPDLKMEIKSCVEKYHSYTRKTKLETTKNGEFKINLAQHQHLLDINGYYLFVVLDLSLGEIRRIKKISAIEVERNFNFTKRNLNKWNYYSMMWTTTFKLKGIAGYDFGEKIWSGREK